MCVCVVKFVFVMDVFDGFLMVEGLNDLILV